MGSMIGPKRSNTCVCSTQIAHKKDSRHTAKGRTWRGLQTNDSKPERETERLIGAT